MLQIELLNHLEKIWDLPDEDIWEVRGPRRHFIYSKIMAWVAFDRAVKSIEEFGRKGTRRQSSHDGPRRFLPPDDKRLRGTVDAIARRLMVDGFVRRYDTQTAEDGLSAGEGAFLACSFWLVDNLVLLGRLGDARGLFERLLALRNDLGLVRGI